MKVLIIIPAYNEALNIVKTVKDVTENTNYDYLVINDCSKDDTKKVCEDNHFHVLSLPTNDGLTSVVHLGMKYAYQKGYDIVIQFDGDGQHQAKYLKDLVKEIENGNCDIAIGSRFVNKKKPVSMRMLGSNLLTMAIKKKMKIKETQVEMSEREFGESYLKPLKSAEYMINMFFSIIFIRAITRKNN